MSGEEKRSSRRLLPAVMRRHKESQIELSEIEKKKKYDVLAALAKALLIFMISYGAVGGFLNAYSITFNWPLVSMSLLALSLVLSLVYETEKKWFTNLFVIGVFIAYAYVALREFWILNSGAYAVINEIYEAAQNYLGVVGGGLYNVQVQDSYKTVTAIALFVGVVLEILMVIRLQYKASLIRTMLISCTLYFVPIYFEKSPDVFSLFMLLSGLLTIAILQFGRVKKHISAQIKQALPVGMIIAAATVLVIGVILPRLRYRMMVPKNPSKEATEVQAMTFAQFGVMALLMNNSTGGGLNEGRLSQNLMMTPTDETHLVVRFTPYAMETTYLKAFTGLDYDGSSWSKATAELGSLEDKMIATSAGRREAYEKDPQSQPRGVMEVFNVGAADGYEYRPYYTDLEEIGRVAVKDFPEGAKYGMQYVYYPRINDNPVERSEEEFVSERYLVVPNICRKAVSEACARAKLSGEPEEIIAKLTDFFDEEYAYTLRPGYYFGGMDYISYFLSRNKKGYCTHFASAGTMMLRQMGIPARYVEGYVFSYTDVVTDGEIVEGAQYEDYYDGYSPLGETALMEVEIPDGQAHAWIEAYLEDYGWIVVDVTPALSLDEEETASFWDAILGAGDQMTQDGQAGQAAAQYLENALAGGLWAFFAIGALIAILYFGRRGILYYRESKLPGRERIKLEYGRMTAWLKERDEAFMKLTTPKEEITYLSEQYGITVPKELNEELYDTFFAPVRERDYEALQKTLRELRGEVKRARRRKRQA